MNAISDTPRTDAMIASVQGGMFPDKADGITAEEDYADKSEALCRQLERELTKLQRSNEKHSYEDLKRIATELESRVKWALNFMKCPGSGMMVSRTVEGGFSEAKHWTLWFADGLEMSGRYKVDRELLGLSKKEQDKILKQRAKKEAQQKQGVTV